MNRKCYRFYGGFLSAQEKWLNAMSDKGYRLVRVGKLLYEFEPCEPGHWQYRVDFVAHKSRQDVEDYARFLHDSGYRTFFKNINLNYSFGKVRYRPWAEKGGRISTHASGFDRELIIAEKEDDGSPFELHTSYEDKISCCRALRSPWLYMFVLFALLGILNRAPVFIVFALISSVPALTYQLQLTKLKREARLKEQ